MSLTARPTLPGVRGLTRTPALRGTHSVPPPAPSFVAPERSSLQRDPKRERSTFAPNESASEVDVDVAIVGGGISGSALLYTLAHFTDLERVLLLERRPQYACVASGPNNNSQTIHCGDIETNYTSTKAADVQKQANLLRNYLVRLPDAERELSCARMQKMALGVGDVECEFMEKRYKQFKEYFPALQLLNKKQIAEVEPAVVLANPRTGAWRPESLAANFVADEHAAVNYFHVANNFIKMAEARTGGLWSAHGPVVKGMLGTEMVRIERQGERWLLETRGGTAGVRKVRARFVVVASCGYSMLTAHRLGFGHDYSCLPVAGSFYFGPEVLRGKVYTVQDPALPFAAVHGDPDLVADRRTRFGPTALPLPLLERYQWHTMPDFLRTVRPSPGLAKVYFDLFRNSATRNYFFKNLCYEIPGLKERLFLPDIQKIVPSLTRKDIHYATGFGGVRPQVVDKRKRKLVLGEGKIDPPNDPIIFNITPSPGGTTCLANARLDTMKIVKFLHCRFDQNKYNNTLLQGPYPTN